MQLLPTRTEPESWSTEELVCWLVDKAAVSYSDVKDVPRAKLIVQVHSALDELYRTFQPRYPRTGKRNVQLSQLMQWAPSTQTERDERASLPVGFRATPLESAIGVCYGIHEKIASMGTQLSWGQHPLDDFRQNLIVIAKGLDAGQASTFLVQNLDQTEAFIFSVRHAVVVPPGHALKQGQRVIIAGSDNPAGNSSSSHSSSSSIPAGLVGKLGTVKALDKASEAVTVVLDVQPAADGSSSSGSGSSSKDETGQEVQVPLLHVLLLAKQAGALSGLEDNRDETGSVVLHGLVGRPELNGRLGVVTGAPPGQASPGRRAVRLLQPLECLPPSAFTKYSTSKAQDPDASDAELLMVKPANLIHVKAPSVGLLVAVHHSKPESAKARRKELQFAQGVLPQLKPFINIRCTAREMPMFVRCVKAMVARLAPCSQPLLARVMEGLKPEGWELAVLLPPQAPEALPRSTMMKQLNEQHKRCRACGKGVDDLQTPAAGSSSSSQQAEQQQVAPASSRSDADSSTPAAAGVAAEAAAASADKLKACSRCKAVWYCSPECQKTDWPRHKREECGSSSSSSSSTAPAAATPSSSGGASNTHLPAGHSPPSGAGTSGTSTSSVVVPIMDPQEVAYATITSPLAGVREMNTTKLPHNRYGTSRFLVKLQNALCPQDMQALGMNPLMSMKGASAKQGIQSWELDQAVIRRNFYQELLVYDQPRTLQFRVFPTTPGYERLVQVMLRHGTGKPGIPTKRVYVWAQREGAHLRLHLEPTPEQVHSW